MRCRLSVPPEWRNAYSGGWCSVSVRFPDVWHAGMPLELNANLVVSEGESAVSYAEMVLLDAGDLLPADTAGLKFTVNDRAVSSATGELLN